MHSAIDSHKKFRQSSWWMFNGIPSPSLSLSLISFIHFTHIQFEFILRLHDHQLPGKATVRTPNKTLASEKQTGKKTKTIKEAMHAFYFILCAERTSDQDENIFFLLSNQHFLHTVKAKSEERRRRRRGFSP